MELESDPTSSANVVQGQVSGLAVLTSVPAGCYLDRLATKESYGSRIKQLGALMLSLEEAIYLQAELGVRLALASASWGPDRDGVDALFLWACQQVPSFPQRYATFRHLRSVGWVVRPDALKFGGDFLVYDGVPDEVHAHYAVLVADPRLQWQEVVRASRLAQVVAKELLVITFPQQVPSEASTASPLSLAAFLASPAAELKEVAVRTTLS